MCYRIKKEKKEMNEGGNWVIATREETASSSSPVGRFPLTTGACSAKREKEGKRAFSFSSSSSTYDDIEEEGNRFELM